MDTPATPEARRSTFYIVDFDRTLADSDKLLEVFIEIAQKYIDIPWEQIEAANADVKARGDSLDTASYVRDRLADSGDIDKWGELEKQFIHESRALNMLLPGANELLRMLNDHHERFGILTYGNPLWQHIKLTAAGFNHVHRIILSQKEKGKLVSSWQQADGTFRLPQEFGGGSADRIVMIDDKAVSFEGFPAEPSQGYYVVDLANILPSQEGNVPANVKQLSDLNTVLEYL